MAPKLITEFIGTFFLVLIIALAVASAGPLAPVAIGLGLMVLVYMGGHVSGAHYNPAVTLAVFLRGKMELPTAAVYMGVQVAAATLAALTARGITGSLLSVAPGANVPLATAITVEALFTFLLALVVLNVATAKQTQGNSYYGAAIGCTVLAGAFAGGGLSGGAFNPAVGLGPALAGAITGHGLPGHAWIYLVGPLLGGAAAALAFRAQKQE
ncbi:MAG: aquaporin [Phycisphaerales bacterium]|nr:aquaporin [Phycisphaerales bacterium]